mgnify:CR=1 FL=1
MKDEWIYAIGLMSGTSLDGLDIAYVKFYNEDFSNFEIVSAETVDYSNFWTQRLQNAIHLDERQISELHREYGIFLGKETQNFIRKNSITNLHFIASHGHTVFHQPEKGITLQVGDGQQISNFTNCTVVSDFRTQDVLLGGQGAPLVPMGDQLLFSEYDACLNLGGFANISYKSNEQRIAFDICPVNIVLNHFSKKIGFDYDDKGGIASQGKLDTKLLSTLNDLAFYNISPPKSLGFEWVQQCIFPIIENNQLESSTILRTFSEHIAQQISRTINPFDHVLFTGGGVYNDFIISKIREYSPSKIIIPSTKIINYKEALVFALLGLLKTQRKVNCLSSVTGAKKNHSSGIIFTPNNRI